MSHGSIEKRHSRTVSTIRWTLEGSAALNHLPHLDPTDERKALLDRVKWCFIEA